MWLLRFSVLYLAKFLICKREGLWVRREKPHNFKVNSNLDETSPAISYYELNDSSFLKTESNIYFKVLYGE